MHEVKRCITSTFLLLHASIDRCGKILPGMSMVIGQRLIYPGGGGEKL